MPDTLDTLVAQWKHDPNPAATVALCEALRDSPQKPLVQQVGEFAAQRHSNDVTVLVSVARMYVHSQRLAEAQTVLLAAGKQAPRDARVYRWLGEVLLRRGDASRASRVLERSLQLHAREPDAQSWLDRARGYEALQKNAGEDAVAAELALGMAKNGSARPAAKTSARPAANGRNGFRVHDEGPPKLDRPSETPTSVAVVPSIRPSAKPVATAPPLPSRFAAPPMAPAPPLPARAAAPPIAPAPPLAPAFASAPFASPPSVPFASPASAPFASPASAPPAPFPAPPSVPFAPFAAPRGSRAPFAPATGAAPGLARTAAAGPAIPYPRDVLDALTLAGVFEPNAGPAAVRWDRPVAGPKRKGTALLISGMALFLAGSVGIYFAYRQKRAADHMQAEALLATVETELHAAKPDALPTMEKELAQALQLQSRNPRAALDWTRERAMSGLLKGGDDVAFEDAMARAKETGVPEETYAFARVASFLLQGDTVGAAGMLPRWDGPAAGDAWYQLVTGAALERAGDGRAASRYAAALKLDADLVAADVGAARVTALEGDPQAAMTAAVALRHKLPDRAEPIALVALAWGRDPNRENLPTPPEVNDLGKRAAELPAGLQFVPHAIAALQADDRHATDEARAEIEKGLTVSGSPGAAVWLGSIALLLDDESLARKAALAALQFSAVYEPARALAARVALGEGRLDEALKATEELDAASVDVAVVRAAAAYERTDADGLARALSALRPDDRKSPVLAALGRGQGELFGTLRMESAQLLSTADDDAPWSDLVAMDAALDQGDLASADRIAASWKQGGSAGADSNPLHAIRLARLARYETRLDAADALSQVAIDHGTVTPRTLSERAFVLVARNRGADLAPLLARYPLVLGPISTWLGAYATASAATSMAQVEAAKAKVATLDPPPDGATFGARLVAAAAFGAMKDHKRGLPYVKELLATGSLHPDLVAAALALGMKRVDHGKRRPTYE
jgi:hypothetical protein